MIVRELVQRVQSGYSRGVESDDSRLSSRYIYNKFLTVRSVLIANRAKDRQKISQWNYQTLPCIEMVLAPIHECPCLPSDDCKILKSKYKIPRVLTDKDRHLIQSVSTLDGSFRFSEILWEDIKNQKGNKYTKTVSGYFIRDEYLYLSHDKEKEVVTMTALFANPEDVYSFVGSCTQETVSCLSPLDKDFPADSELLDGMISISVQELINLFSRTSVDEANNASDDVNVQQKTSRRD